MGLVWLVVLGDEGEVTYPAVLTIAVFLKAGLDWLPPSEKQVVVYVTTFPFLLWI